MLRTRLKSSATGRRGRKGGGAGRRQMRHAFQLATQWLRPPVPTGWKIESRCARLNYKGGVCVIQGGGPGPGRLPACTADARAGCRAGSWAGAGLGWMKHGAYHPGSHSNPSPVST